MSNARIRAGQGFTLIELLLAVFIGAFLIVPLVTITSGVADNSAQQRELNETQTRARVGMDAMKQDIGRAAFQSSPNTAADPAACPDLQFGIWRPGFVLYNGAGPNQSDQLMVVGNLMGSGSYYIEQLNPSGTIQIRDLSVDRTKWTGIPYKDCFDSYKPYTSAVHVINKERFVADLPVKSVNLPPAQHANGGWVCDVTVDLTMVGSFSIESTGRCGIGGFGTGSVVQANQAALYRLEPSRTPGLYDLTRTLAEVNKDPKTPSDLSLNATTRTVMIAGAVDFQVWFRPASTGGGANQRVRYVSLKAGGNDEIVPDPDDCLVTVPEEQTSQYFGQDHIDRCKRVGVTSGGSYAKLNQHQEWMRSVVVKVAVASFHEDPQLRGTFDASMNPRDYLINLPDAGPGKARVATFETEIELNNLSMRDDVDLLKIDEVWP